MPSPNDPTQFQLEALLTRHGSRRELFNALQKLVDSSSMAGQLTTPTVVSRLCAETTQLLEGSVNPETLEQLQTLLRVVQKLAVNQNGHLSQSQSQHDVFLALLEPAIVNMISDVLLAALHAVQRSDSEITDKLYEELLETINAVADHSQEAKSIMARYFCDRLLHVVVMSRLRFTVRMETLKRLNLVLEKCCLAARDMLEQNPIHRELLHKLARTILSVGDYEFQVAIIESLLRFTPKRVRQEKANTWFPEREFSRAFLKIRDSEFETDCRRFLNTINKILDDKAMVVSVPCLTVHLGDLQLQKPEDENYSHFWVDFNLGSKRITMFCEQKTVIASQECEENLWETVSIWDEHVSSYALEDSASIQKVKLYLITNARDLISFGPRFTSKLMVITFARQHHVFTLLEKTFGKAKSAAHKKTKISAVEKPIQVHHKDSPPKIPETITEEGVSCYSARDEIQFSQNSRASERGISCKVSVPAEQMRVPSLYCIDRVESSTYNSHKEAEEQPGKQALGCKKKKASESPATRKKNKQSERIKVPLCLKPTGDTEQLPMKGGCGKASMPTSSMMARQLGQIVIQHQMEKQNEQQIYHPQKITRVGDQNDHDAVIPSSVPEEQILVVPDSQFPLPKRMELPALRLPIHLDTSIKQLEQRLKQTSDDSGVSMDVSGNMSAEKDKLDVYQMENTEDIGNCYEQPMDPCRFLTKNASKVSLTPALSTVTEESTTPGTGHSTHKNLAAITEEDPILIASHPASVSQMLSSPTLSIQRCSPHMSPDSTQPACADASRRATRSRNGRTAPVQVETMEQREISSKNNSGKKEVTKVKAKKTVRKKTASPKRQRVLRSKSKTDVEESLTEGLELDTEVSRVEKDSSPCHKLQSNHTNDDSDVGSDEAGTRSLAAMQSLPIQQKRKLPRNRRKKSDSKSEPITRNESDSESESHSRVSVSPPCELSRKQSLPERIQARKDRLLSPNINQHQASNVQTYRETSGAVAGHDRSEDQIPVNPFNSGLLSTKSFYSSSKKTCYEPKFFKSRARKQTEQMSVKLMAKHMYDFESDNEESGEQIQTNIPIQNEMPQNKTTLTKTSNKGPQKKKMQSTDTYSFTDDIQDENISPTVDAPCVAQGGKKKTKTREKLNAETKSGQSRMAALRKKRQALEKVSIDEDTFLFSLESPEEDSNLPSGSKCGRKKTQPSEPCKVSESDKHTKLGAQSRKRGKENNLTAVDDDAFHLKSRNPEQPIVCTKATDARPKQKKADKNDQKNSSKTIQSTTSFSTPSAQKRCLDFANSDTVTPVSRRKQIVSEERSKHVENAVQKVVSEEYDPTPKGLCALKNSGQKNKGQKKVDVRHKNVSRQSHRRNLKQFHSGSASKVQSDENELEIENASEESDEADRTLAEENGQEADISTNILDGESCLASFAEACKDIVKTSGARIARNTRAVDYRETSESEAEIETPAKALQKDFRQRALKDINRETKDSNRPVQKCEKKKRQKKSIFSETDETADSRSEVSWLASTARKKKPKLARDYTHHHQENEWPGHNNEEDNIMSENTLSRILPPTKPHKGPKKQRETTKTPTHVSAQQEEGNLYYQPVEKRQRLTRQGRSHELATSKTVHTRQIQLSEELMSHLGTPLASKNLIISHSVSTHGHATTDFNDLDTSVLKTPVTPAAQRIVEEEPLSIERFRSSSMLGMAPRAISPIMPLDDSREPSLSQLSLENFDLTPASALTTATGFTQMSSLKTPEDGKLLEETQDSLNYSAIDAEDLLICDQNSSDILLKSGPCQRKKKNSELTLCVEHGASSGEENTDEGSNSQPQSSSGIRPRRLFNFDANTSSSAKKKSKIPVRKLMPPSPPPSEGEEACRSEEEEACRSEEEEDDESEEQSDLELRLDISAERDKDKIEATPTSGEDANESEVRNTSICPSEELLPMNMDMHLNMGVSAIIKSFGTEIQRNVMTKRQKIDEITRDTIKSTESGVSSIWKDQQLYREKTVKQFTESVMSELNKMQTDIEDMKGVERQVMEFVKQQQKLVESCRLAQNERLHNLKTFQTDFNSDMKTIDTRQKQQQDGVREVLKKEIDVLQKKLLRQTQQEEIRNVKRSLQMLFI